MPDDTSLVKVKVGQPTGLRARVQAAKENPNAGQEPLSPDKAANRIEIIFDDSGSMSGEPLQNAKKAVTAFLQQCNPKDTVVGVQPLNGDAIPMSNMMATLAVRVQSIKDSGGTPLYNTMHIVIAREEAMNRMVIFSDGAPTDQLIVTIPAGVGEYQKIDVIDQYVKKRIPVDTVYIGLGDNEALKQIAERTGGIYMNFKDSKSLASGFKYLAPAYRAMLMNDEVRKKVERGESI